MNGWHEGRVAANEREAAGLHAVHIDVSGTPLVGSHSLPGQYVRLALPALPQAGEGMFAIASGPDQTGTSFELLVKGGSDLADALMTAEVGTRVLLTAPEGPGFPLDAARGRCVLLFATGSAIGAIRSLIHEILHERTAFKDVTLYFGARTPDAFAYEDEMDAWRARGIDVVRTVSRPGEAGWKGLTGYVQAHLPNAQLDDSVAFVCGQAEMVDGVREALRARGVADERIFLNV